MKFKTDLLWILFAFLNACRIWAYLSWVYLNAKSQSFFRKSRRQLFELLRGKSGFQFNSFEIPSFAVLFNKPTQKIEKFSVFPPPPPTESLCQRKSHISALQSLCTTALSDLIMRALLIIKQFFFSYCKLQPLGIWLFFFLA